MYPPRDPSCWAAFFLIINQVEVSGHVAKHQQCSKRNSHIGPTKLDHWKGVGVDVEARQSKFHASDQKEEEEEGHDKIEAEFNPLHCPLTPLEREIIHTDVGVAIEGHARPDINNPDERISSHFFRPNDWCPKKIAAHHLREHEDNNEPHENGYDVFKEPVHIRVDPFHHKTSLLRKLLSRCSDLLNDRF